MFDVKSEYISAYTARAEYLRSDHPSEAVIQAYDTLINVLSNDVRFRAQGYIELNQPRENDEQMFDYSPTNQGD